MTRRAALAIACAVLLVGGNTALMLHLRSGRPAGDRFPSGRPPADPPPEHPVRPRPFAAGEPLLPREEARALRVLVADPAGAPVPGAVVRVRAHRRVRRGPFPDPVLAEGRTGGDGAASFPALPARARYLAEAEAPGRAPGSADGPGPELAVLLHGAGVLSGRVLEEGTDAPVEGAEVELLPAADTDPPEAPNRRLHPPAEARCATGSDGTFRFEGLPPGTWRVRVRPLLHGPPGEDAAATLGEGGEAVLDVRVRRGVDVAGRVLFAGSDRPLAGGILRVAASSGFGRPPSWVREVPLDGEGRFLLPSLPAWTAAPAAFATSPAGAVASAPFPRPVIDPATGRQAGEVVVHIPWNNPAGLAYAGRVTDARGAPVAGARVLVGEGLPVLVGMRDRGGVAGGGGEAWTGVDGKWSLAAQGHLGGEVLVLHPDFAPGYFLLPYRSRNRTFDFTLADPAALLVLARDAAGRGVAGAEVRALLRHPEETLGRLTFGDVLEGLRANPVTDRDGRALVGPLGPGSWYLAARSADGRLAGRVPLALEEGAAGVVEIPMEALPPVEGRVADLDGGGVAGAEVCITDGYTGEERQVRTDGDGRFSLPGVPPVSWPSVGRGVVLAVRPGEGWRAGTPLLEVMPGEPALWTLARKGEAEGSLLVKAVDGGGRPLMEGSWEIRFANGRGGRAEGWGGEGIGQAIFTVPLVRGRGAVLTVKAAGAGEGSVGLDALPIGTESLDVVTD